MDNKLFDVLLTSLKEAGAIHRSELEPSRIFTYEIPEVKSIREKTGLTQVEFANKLHISHVRCKIGSKVIVIRQDLR